jgi:tripartite-type tricarboxylate transporter receptor subunit TctC
MQRGEVDGAMSSLNTLKTTQRDWLDRGLVRILLQYAPRRTRELPNVAAVVELGATPDDKDVLGFYANSGTVGRAVMAPPGLPPERLALLRQAFDATMKDADFLAEIAATKLDLEPLTGAELQALIEASTKVSSTVLVRAKAARGE